MKYLIPIILATSIIACGPKKETREIKSPPTLTKKWETDTLLTTSESVIYDDKNNVLYVSNINGDPSTKDGNGFISTVSLEGKVTNATWVTGMDAPKGMGIYNGKLYVSDIDRVHEVDITSAKIINSYKYDSAKFFNDITIDSTGTVYVSDTGAGTILKLENGALVVWVEGVAGVNGLLAEGNDLQMVSFELGVFNTIDANKQITERTDSLPNGDGIESLEEGGYLVSCWDGVVHYVSPEWKNTVLLDTRADTISAADIEYIAEKRLLLVPTFFKNTVVAYEVSK
jgi:hypothetical protein